MSKKCYFSSEILNNVKSINLNLLENLIKLHFTYWIMDGFHIFFIDTDSIVSSSAISTLKEAQKIFPHITINCVSGNSTHYATLGDRYFIITDREIPPNEIVEFAKENKIDLFILNCHNYHIIYYHFN